MSDPLDEHELIALRACLHDEVTQPEGADPEVHGLYDYYETCKRLMVNVDALRAEVEALRGERDSFERTAATLMNVAKGMRQVLKGISGMCMDAGNETPFFCDEKAGKHSCYCPVTPATKVLELTRWLDAADEKETTTK